MTAMSDKSEQGALTNAEAIIERFGGIRPMASKMSVPVTTVQGWKKRNVIPENRRADVMQAATLNHIDITDLVENTANENGRESAETTKGGGFADNLRQVSDDAADDNGNSPYRNDELTRPDAVKPAVYGSSSFMSPSYAAKHQTQSRKPDGSDVHAFRREASSVERRAVFKSVFLSLVLIAALGAVGGAVVMAELGDVRGHISTLENKAGSLDQRVGLLEQGKNMVASVLPVDVQQKLAGIEDQITTLSARLQNGVSGSALSPDAGGLAPRVSALEEKLNRLAHSGDIKTLIGQLQGMEATQDGQQQLAGLVHTLYGAVQNAASGSAIGDTLSQALKTSDAGGAVLKDINADDVKQAALVIGLAGLKASLSRSAPFDEDLQLLSLVMGDSMPADLKTAIAQIAPQAKQGVLTQNALIDQLQTLAPGIVEASLEGGDVTIRDKAMARLNDVMQVSKGGRLVSGTDTQSVLARAQSLLGKGDIQGTITALQGLHGGALNAAGPFIAAAQASVTANDLQTSITHTVSSTLGIGGAPLTTGDAGFKALINRAGVTLPDGIVSGGVMSAH
jgi:hypothetical protein